MRYCSGEQIKEEEMKSAHWLVWWGKWNARRVLTGKPAGMRPLGTVGGMIILLQWFLKKQDGSHWAGLIWLRTGTSSGPFCDVTLGTHLTMQCLISWDLSLCSMCCDYANNKSHVWERITEFYKERTMFTSFADRDRCRPNFSATYWLLGIPHIKNISSHF